jgi:hypothetical protein
MNQQGPANPEPDPRFPCGAWTGFFLQYWLPGRNKMDLDLEWENGTVTGSGHDRVGPFTIEGTYDTATGRCEWTKQYLRRHSVAYRGVNDGHGIWGVWEIRQLGGLYVDRGGFHIWPEGTDVSEESDRTERAVLASMNKEFGAAPVHPALVQLLLLLAGAALALFVWWRFAS